MTEHYQKWADDVALGGGAPAYQGAQTMAWLLAEARYWADIVRDALGPVAQRFPWEAQNVP
jgi:hypothetical protein